MCYTLNEIKEKTVPIAKEYGIQSLGVFGSYARNEATDESDVDICVEKGSLKSLIQYFAFVQELEKILKCHVDVVTTEIEDTDFINQVLKERVLLYERQG
jgi:predicted nucleotidyltransferase